MQILSTPLLLAHSIHTFTYSKTTTNKRRVTYTTPLKELPYSAKTNTIIKIANNNETMKLKIGNAFFSFFLNSNFKLRKIFTGTSIK